MVAHSLEDVKYLQSVGFDRVVLARELNVDEIKWICENTTVDIEVLYMELYVYVTRVNAL